MLEVLILPYGYNLSHTLFMKTAIFIPDSIFEQAEEVAKELRMSCSELYTTALREFLHERQTADVIERLNQVYTEEVSNLDPALVQMQASSLPAEEW